MKVRSNGDQTDIWVRKTLCFRKIDNEWKIIHEHQSVPLSMDGSNKAAVDSNQGIKCKTRQHRPLWTSTNNL